MCSLALTTIILSKVSKNVNCLISPLNGLESEDGHECVRDCSDENWKVQNEVSQIANLRIVDFEISQNHDRGKNGSAHHRRHGVDAN